MNRAGAETRIRAHGSIAARKSSGSKSGLPHRIRYKDRYPNPPIGVLMDSRDVRVRRAFCSWPNPPVIVGLEPVNLPVDTLKEFPIKAPPLQSVLDVVSRPESTMNPDR